MRKQPNIKPINLKRPEPPPKPPDKKKNIIVIEQGVQCETIIRQRIKLMIYKLNEVLNGNRTKNS